MGCYARQPNAISWHAAWQPSFPCSCFYLFLSSLLSIWREARDRKCSSSGGYGKVTSEYQHPLPPVLLENLRDCGSLRGSGKRRKKKVERGRDTVELSGNVENMSERALTCLGGDCIGCAGSSFVDTIGRTFVVPSEFDQKALSVKPDPTAPFSRSTSPSPTLPP